MSYQLGIDVGTTYSAAAVHRDGRAAIASLGARAAIIPSVVLLREDGTFLTGDAADRRAASEPERVVREFKRRLGDSTPIIVAGSPYSAEALTARLLTAIVDKVAQTEGAQPERIIVTHPANWGNFKVDLLGQAVRLAGLSPDVVSFITEPEAAAISYAAQERVEPGEIVAVYDLGGGTFDAAVLQRTHSGFSIIGRPEGIERLGGIDFDAAVFAHVTSNLGDALTELDPDDPAALTAVARLRRDCVEAKEALSSDTDAIVPIMLPGRQTEVRITRSEFEGLIRPSLMDSINAMHRAVESAEIEMSDVSRILLVGGSSRIPVVSQLVASLLDRPVAVDTHPKHTVALGAAFTAGGVFGSANGAELGVGAEAHSLVSPPAEEPTPPPETAAGPPAGQTRVADNPPPLPVKRRPQPAPAESPGSSNIQAPAAVESAGPRHPPKARPVTTPGLAPPPSSTSPRSPQPPPDGGVGAGPGRAGGGISRPPPANSLAEGERSPAKARPAASPGTNPPPKARPVTSPGSTPPPNNPVRPRPSGPSGGIGKAPSAPVVGLDNERPRSAAASAGGLVDPRSNPLAAAEARTAVFPHGVPPGLAAHDVSGDRAGGNSFVWWLLLAAVFIAVVGVVVLWAAR